MESIHLFKTNASEFNDQKSRANHIRYRVNIIFLFSNYSNKKRVQGVLYVQKETFNRVYRYQGIFF